MNETKRIPAHVSLIMDGNGRWAQSRGKQRLEGHFEGVESVRACVQEAVRCGVRYLSIYAFSEENWGRPEAEVNGLMELMVDSMYAEMPSLNRNGVRFRVLGHLERLSERVRKVIAECEAMTAGNTRLDLMVMMSYSGKWDILQAARKAAAEAVGEAQNPAQALEKVKNISYDDISAHLVTAGVPDPDLIVRTSGESRLSNYFLWQGAYSELVFTDVLWPDFREEAFRAALEEFSRRDRRYGKVK